MHRHLSKRAKLTWALINSAACWMCWPHTQEKVSLLFVIINEPSERRFQSTTAARGAHTQVSELMPACAPQSAQSEETDSHLQITAAFNLDWPGYRAELPVSIESPRWLLVLFISSAFLVANHFHAARQKLEILHHRYFKMPLRD